MAEKPALSPYLQGNYAPVAEETDADDLQVTGEIPRDLEGIFIRNGSNPRFSQAGRYHWFDGDGMLHSVHFGAGKAKYKNRYIRTAAFLAEEAAGRSLWSGVTERPDFTNPRGPFKDSANTDVVYHAGRLYCLWWLGGQPYLVHLPDLATVGPVNFGAVRTVSAHPKVDPIAGELRFFDYKPTPPYLSYGVLDKNGELRHHTTIDLPGPRLQHDMAITENHSIFLDMSLMWDPELLKEGRTKVRFFRDKPTRFGVLSRYAQGSAIRWFDVAPCYMYHTINAWEDGQRIVILGCRIADPLAEDPDNPPSTEVPTIGFLRLSPHLHRWTLDLQTGQTKEEQLDDRLCEFPRMDNRHLGTRSRYSYGQQIAQAETLLFDGVIKYDDRTGTSVTHRYPAGFYGGETVFAPADPESRDPADEDRGYLITFVVEEHTGKSECHVINAQDPSGPPVARVQIPVRVPTGYHAWWVAGELTP